MADIIVTRGLPASGKSTWAKAWVAADPEGRVRVNRDDIRYMLYGKYWGVDEVAVTKMEEALVTAALKAGKRVVVDATHLRASHASRWYKFGTVEFQGFEAPVQDLVDRDIHRAEAGQRSVGASVIRDMAQRFQIGPYGKLPSQPRNTGALPSFAPYVRGDILAYSFDIDGTLLQMNGKRGPYDTSLYHLDDADPNMAVLLWHLRDFASTQADPIVFFGLSGRSEDFRAETEASLEGWGLALDFLLMRPSDQPTVNDAIIKSDLVDKHVSGVYDVIMHFDDRNRVVDALRAKGMKVAQVAPGDF